MVNKMNAERIVFNNKTFGSYDFLKDNESDEGAIARAVAYYTAELTHLIDHVKTFGGDYWQRRVTVCFDLTTNTARGIIVQN